MRHKTTFSITLTRGYLKVRHELPCSQEVVPMYMQNLAPKRMHGIHQEMVPALHKDMDTQGCTECGDRKNEIRLQVEQVLDLDLVHLR